MADLEAIEVLQQAKDRILESGWGKGSANNRSRKGDRYSMCIEDGICGVRGAYLSNAEFQGTPMQRAGDYIRQVVGLEDHLDLYCWNDSEVASEGEVYAAIDDAILIAKEAPYAETV